MIKAVIFDMDGVLIDSVHLGLQMRKRLLVQYGVDLDTVPDPQGEGHRAASLKMLLTNIERHTGVHIDQDEFARQSIQYMQQELQQQSVSADRELIKFLEDLKRHKVVCAITSSGLREGVANKLQVLGIQHYFSVIVTGSDVTEHKPHPQAYKQTIQKLNLSPQDCIIVEDSLTGVQAGRAAGCKVIGFTQYHQPVQPLPGVALAVHTWPEMSYDTLQRLDTQQS